MQPDLCTFEHCSQMCLNPPKNFWQFVMFGMPQFWVSYFLAYIQAGKFIYLQSLWTWPQFEAGMNYIVCAYAVGMGWHNIMLLLHVKPRQWPHPHPAFVEVQCLLSIQSNFTPWCINEAGICLQEVFIRGHTVCHVNAQFSSCKAVRCDWTTQCFDCFYPT